MTDVLNSSYTSIEDSISTTVNSLGLGITTIWHNNNGVEPETSYLAMVVVSDTAMSSPYESVLVNGTTREVTLTAQYEAVVRFQFIGKNKQNGASDVNSSNIAKTFETKMRFAGTRLKFADNGLSVVRIGSLKQIPVMRDNAIYTNTAIDIVFGYEHITKDVYNIVDSVNIVGTLTEGGNGDVVMQPTLGI
jgi:hypothetical protein